MNKLLLILLLFTTPLFATDPGYEAEPSPLRTLYSSSTGQGGYITNFKAPTEKLQIKAGNGVDLQKTGHLGNATEFNGVAWAEITGATHPIGLLNDYTLVIAHKSTDTTTGLDGEPYSESINIGGSTVKDRLILTYGSTTMTYRFIYDVASGTDTDTSFSVTKDTNYHMYVARRSGTTFTTKFDNVAKTSQTVSASTISGINRICFGINCSLVVGTGSDQWKGQLDEVYIYDFALSDADLTTIYNSGTWTSATSSDDHIVNGWHFDEDDHGSTNNPAAFENITSLMAAGDHWTVLQGGQYEKPGRVCGTKNVSTCWQFANTAGAGSEHSSTGDGQDGTATHPIVIEGEDNGTVIKSVITGCTVVYADYLWFKNLDFDGSCDISDAINFNSASRGAKVINNYIHDTSEDNLDHHCPASGDPTNPANDSGISDFSGGGDTYLYGNMEWNTRYGLYQHNDSKANPIDYVIKNIVFNIKEKWQDNSTHTACVHGESQNLQQYSQSGATFHQYDYKNVLFDSESTQGFRDSGILGGGTTTPNIDLVFTENYTYNIPLWQFGDSTPIQLTYTNNYIGNGGANFFRWEGSGETCAASLPYPTDGQIITGNTLVPDTVFSAKTVQITTQIWNPGGVPVCSTRLNGTQPFRSVDIISNNTYLGTGLTYDIFCNNSNLTNQTFANYKSAGIACGLASFETGTTTGAHPSTPKIFLNLNDYDSTQATLVVYNWAGTANVTIPHALLDTFLVNCEGFDAYDVEDIFGGTVYSTTYNGADVSFPVGATNEFKTYLLKKVI